VLAVTQQLLVIAGQGPAGWPVPPARRRSTPPSPAAVGTGPGLRTNAAARRLHELIDHVRVTLLGMALDRSPTTARPMTRSTTWI